LKLAHDYTLQIKHNAIIPHLSYLQQNSSF
jgi:hypothetical protein